jgi:hypothetical protein
MDCMFRLDMENMDWFEYLVQKMLPNSTYFGQLFDSWGTLLMV